MKMQDAAFMAGLADFNAFKAGAANAGRDIQRHKRSGLKALVVKNVADKYRKLSIVLHFRLRCCLRCEETALILYLIV